MTCDELRSILARDPSLLRECGTLPPSAAHHLAACPACAAHYRAEQALERLLSDSAPARALPPRLGRRLDAALRGARVRPGLPWPAVAAVSATVVTALAVGGLLTWRQPTSGAPHGAAPVTTAVAPALPEPPAAVPATPTPTVQPTEKPLAEAKPAHSRRAASRPSPGRAGPRRAPAGPGAGTAVVDVASMDTRAIEEALALPETRAVLEVRAASHSFEVPVSAPADPVRNVSLASPGSLSPEPVRNAPATGAPTRPSEVAQP